MGLGSGIRDPEKKPIPDPGLGVKKAPDPGSATLLLTLKSRVVNKKFVFETNGSTATEHAFLLFNLIHYGWP
jgi:hypothetical protein